MAGRDSRGRFLKGSSRKGTTTITRARRSSSGGGAIIVRERSAPVVRRNGPPQKRRSSGGGGRAGTQVRKGAAIGGFILGYAKANHAAVLDKIPKIKGSVMGTIALGLHFLAKPRPGGMTDHIATAATAIAAYEIGQTGLGSLSGDDDGASW